MHSDVYGAGSITGLSQSPLRFFELEDPKQRCYFEDKDLLKGQIAWDAFLLKNFISTHLDRIKKEAEDGMKSKCANSFLQMVCENQSSYLSWTGWKRKHNPSTYLVMEQIEKGNYFEAVAIISKMKKERELKDAQRKNEAKKQATLLLSDGNTSKLLDDTLQHIKNDDMDISDSATTDYLIATESRDE